jgi:hypothetical protein
MIIKRMVRLTLLKLLKSELKTKIQFKNHPNNLGVLN